MRVLHNNSDPDEEGKLIHVYQLFLSVPLSVVIEMICVTLIAIKAIVEQRGTLEKQNIVLCLFRVNL